MIQKLIRDFYQYLRNSFDSIGQIANAGLLANKGKKVDKTDFPAMKDRFQQQTYSGEFPLTSAWFSKTDSDDEFKRCDALDLVVSCYRVDSGLLFQFPEPENLIGNLIVGFLVVGLFEQFLLQGQ